MKSLCIFSAKQTERIRASATERKNYYGTYTSLKRNDMRSFVHIPSERQRSYVKT